MKRTTKKEQLYYYNIIIHIYFFKIKILLIFLGCEKFIMRN